MFAAALLPRSRSPAPTAVEYGASTNYGLNASAPLGADDVQVTTAPPAAALHTPAIGARRALNAVEIAQTAGRGAFGILPFDGAVARALGLLAWRGDDQADLRDVPIETVARATALGQPVYTADYSQFRAAADMQAELRRTNGPVHVGVQAIPGRVDALALVRALSDLFAPLDVHVYVLPPVAFC